MKIEKFEDIKAWQEARKLTIILYTITAREKFRKDFALCDQIKRAAISVMANIVEGFDSQSDIEFIKFLIYARRSATEIQSHLYIALDTGYITDKEFNGFYIKLTEIKNLLNGFIRYLKKERQK